MTEELALPRLRLRAGARVARDRLARRRATASSSAASGVEPSETYTTISPATEEPLAEVGQASAEDVDAAVARRARRVRGRLVGAAPGRAREVPVPDRAAAAGARARVRGARVAQRRQADQGVARRRPAARRRALLLLRRLGRQARVRVPEPAPAAGRRRRPDHPVELPAADARVEDRPGARGRQHGRAQAGRDDAADGAAVLRRAAPGRAAARRRQHRHRRRPHRRRARRARRRRQDRVHRLDRGRQGDPARARRQRQAADARARRQGGEHRLRRRAARPGGRGHRQRHLLQPGPRLLRRLAPARAGVDPAAADREAQAPAVARCASATRSTRTPTSARSTPPRSSRGSRSSSPRASRRAPRSTSRRASCPSSGYWFAPTVFTDVAQSHRIAQEEIFGPVLSVLTFRTPEEAIEKANNTAYGLSAGVWTEKGSRILWMAQRLRAGVVWANTFNRFDPTSPFGGYKESGFGREGGLHGLEPYLRFDGTARSGADDARAGAQDLQALPGRRVPALGVGAHLRGRGAQHRAGVAQGPPRRGARGARRARQVVGHDGVQPRPGALPRRRDAGGAGGRAGRAVRRRARRSSAPSTASSGTRAGPTSSPRCSAARTRSPGRTSTSRCRSRPAWSGSSRPPSRRCSGSSRGSRRCSRAATPRS